MVIFTCLINASHIQWGKEGSDLLSPVINDSCVFVSISVLSYFDDRMTILVVWSCLVDPSLRHNLMTRHYLVYALLACVLFLHILLCNTRKYFLSVVLSLNCMNSPIILFASQSCRTIIHLLMLSYLTGNINVLSVHLSAGSSMNFEHAS